jgi:hypothetical protein
MGGSAAYEAGQDEDLQRAQKILGTLDEVKLPDSGTTLTLPELVADILARNSTGTQAVKPAQSQVPAAPGTAATVVEPEAPDLFLSYASMRRANVLPIRNALVGLGYSVFFDTESLSAGEEFADVIDGRLKSAKAVIACFSHESFKSRWCKSEWRVAMHKGNLVPLAIDRISIVEVPTEFNSLHYCDFSNFSGSTTEPCFRDLLRSTQRHVRV